MKEKKEKKTLKKTKPPVSGSSPAEKRTGSAGVKKQVKKKTVKDLSVTRKGLSAAVSGKPVTRQKKPSIKKNPPPALKSSGQLTGTSEELALQRGDTPMSVVDHLDEFRHRFLVSLIVLICITIGAFYLSDLLLKFISGPFLATGKSLNIFTMTGGFIARLKTSAVAALLLSLPVFLYHLWKYIEPAVEVESRWGVRFSLAGALLLFYSGVSFVFFIVLPFTVEMLISFIDSNMIPTIGADDYLSFIFLFCLAMGIVFELPVMVMILTKVGVLSPQYLMAKRKYAIVVIWIMAAVITPPDVVSQVIIALPVMLLYEISIRVSRYVIIKKKRMELTA